jgi:hypothetical protein
MPTPEESKILRHVHQIEIIRILTAHATGFERYTSLSELNHISIYQIPHFRKTEFYPLQVAPIEEVSVEGQLKVVDNLDLDQLKHNSSGAIEELSKYATLLLPIFQPQRGRGAQMLRQGDKNANHRREHLQLAFGMFHATMNPMYGILATH